MAVSLRGLKLPVRQAAERCLKAFQAQYGFSPTITSTYRSIAEQLRLYRDWLAGKSPWPANPPGQSGHNYGLAFDSWVPDGYMAAWIRIRRAHGFHVPENDIIHAEVPSWWLARGVPTKAKPVAATPPTPPIGSRVLGALRTIGSLF